jgi:hypothetical protein
MLINFDSKNIAYGPRSNFALINSDIFEPRNMFDQTLNLNDFRLEGQIGIFEGAISPEMCKYIINTVDVNGRWEKAITVGEGQGTVARENSPRQNDIAWISGVPFFQDLDGYIHQAMKKTINMYLDKISGLSVGTAGITQDEGYSLLRYRESGYYHQHIDYSSISTKESAGTIRVVSSLIYLNDDYEGGEIFFERQGLKLKPKAGTIVFFPSIFTHPHASLEIKKGTKYSMVTWWK